MTVLFDWSKVPLELGLVTLAFMLCSIIGLERQFQHKAAGVRTHSLVGLGSCVFTLISVHGFIGLAEYQVTRDPSRISAQIVSGIGFLGAGLIFVNRDVVRGLTTAASSISMESIRASASARRDGSMNSATVSCERRP